MTTRRQTTKVGRPPVIKDGRGAEGFIINTGQAIYFFAVRGVPSNPILLGPSHRACVFRVQDPSVQQRDSGHVESCHLLRVLEPTDTVEPYIYIKPVLEPRKHLDNSVQLRW